MSTKIALKKAHGNSDDGWKSDGVDCKETENDADFTLTHLYGS